MEATKRTRRTLKQIKDTSIKIRITSDKKDEIKKYCEKNNMSMTDFLNFAIDEMLKR